MWGVGNDRRRGWGTGATFVLAGGGRILPATNGCSRLSYPPFLPIMPHSQGQRDYLPLHWPLFVAITTNLQSAQGAIIHCSEHLDKELCKLTTANFAL